MLKFMISPFQEGNERGKERRRSPELMVGAQGIREVITEQKKAKCLQQKMNKTMRN